MMKNVYVCPKCGHGFVSIDADEGTTPFLTQCLQEGCDGLARSFMYNVPQQVLADVKPALEWYRPATTEGLSPSVAGHVRAGGLLSRRTK